MTTAEQYATALFQLTENAPEKNEQYLAHLRAALKVRGHEKLLPHILSAYEKLSLKKERARRAAEVTPDMRRTQILLELYQRLIETSVITN